MSDGEGSGELGERPASPLADYEIGYRKPPPKNQFQPGKSGNPKGRPKRCPSSQETFQKVIMMPVVIVEGGRKRKVSTQEALFIKMRRAALEGDARDRRALLDLIERYAPEQMQSITDLFAEDTRLLQELMRRGDGDGISEGGDDQ